MTTLDEIAHRCREVEHLPIKRWLPPLYPTATLWYRLATGQPKAMTEAGRARWRRLLPALRALVASGADRFYQNDLSRDTVDAAELRSLFAHGVIGRKDFADHSWHYTIRPETAWFCDAALAALAVLP